MKNRLNNHVAIPAAHPKTSVPKLHILYPVLTSMPDICVSTQNKLSFAWETIIEPAPIDNITRAFDTPESKPSEDIKGARIDAVVTIATVDEPCAVLIEDTRMNGSQIPRFARDKESPIIDAIPEF